jgi:chaperone required for assembly of F1-ATPase
VEGEVKRFWSEVRVALRGGMWGIELDAKPLKTPAREALVVPSEALAEAIKNEWSEAFGDVDPRAMPLTGLANAAVDRVVPDSANFALNLAKYAEADLFCYRAEGPPRLIARQAAEWDAMLGWARRRFDVEFVVTSGIVHVAQPDATVARLAHEVAVLDAYRLAALSPLVTIGGSLIAALALIEAAIPLETIWSAVSLDERWQIEVWGDDDEAVASLEHRRVDYAAAAGFIRLLSA